MFELVHRDVRGQVVDPVQRLAERERIGLGGGHTDQQRAREPWPRGHRERVDLRKPHAREPQGAVHGRHHRLQMRAARHLGDHPAEPRMLVDARGDRVGEQGVAAHDPDAGLVARRLDAEHERPGHRLPAASGWPPCGRRRRITMASAPDGW